MEREKTRLFIKKRRSAFEREVSKLARLTVGFFLLAALALEPAARADTTFVDGQLNCDKTTMVCSGTYIFSFPVIVGIDTVLAPNGATVVQTLTDYYVDTALSPTLANDIATDPAQPPQLQANLAPFTLLTDLQFVDDNFYLGQNLPGCPNPPSGLFLNQAGSLITAVTRQSLGSETYSSPNILADLTSAVSNATVSSDSISAYGDDVYNLDITGGSTVCGQTLPVGYTSLMVQSVVVTASVEHITEVQNSSVPEPRSAYELFAGATVALWIAKRKGIRR
jgi:hypothetical protein